METINRIRFNNTKEPLVRRYGLSQRLTVPKGNGEGSYYLDHIEVLLNGEDDRGRIDNFLLSDEVRRSVAELLQVNGIFWVLVRPFELLIKIEYAFDWSDVEDEVLRIIRSNLFADREVDVQDRTQTQTAE